MINLDLGNGDVSVDLTKHILFYRGKAIKLDQINSSTLLVDSSSFPLWTIIGAIIGYFVMKIAVTFGFIILAISIIRIALHFWMKKTYYLEIIMSSSERIRIQGDQEKLVQLHQILNQ